MIECGYCDERLYPDPDGRLRHSCQPEKDLLMMCIKDLYSQSGNFKKKTGLALFKYVNANNIDVNP